MSSPAYAAVWDRNPIYRGDTLDGFSMKMTKRDGTLDAIVPVIVCAHIVDGFGRMVAPMNHVIAADGTVTFERIDGVVTAQWRAGLYAYDVEYTTTDGRVRTYLTGSITVIEDKSKCPAP